MEISTSILNLNKENYIRKLYNLETAKTYSKIIEPKEK